MLVVVRGIFAAKAFEVLKVEAFKANPKETVPLCLPAVKGRHTSA